MTFLGATNFGSSDLTVATTRNIIVFNGASVAADTITLRANTNGATTGNFIGIDLRTGAQIVGGVNDSAVILNGQGGLGSGSQNYGVLVQGSGTTINSLGGSVQVTGRGGGSGSSSGNVGVFVSNGGKITAGVNGSVTVDGTGGSGSAGSNVGLSVRNTNSIITSGGGAVLLIGQGGATGNDNIGVDVSFGGEITAGGAGGVTVQGTGGTSAGTRNYGVNTGGSGSRITSGGGDVQVVGIGGGSSSSSNNDGVMVSNGSAISAGASGNVSVQGVGGNTTGANNDGVQLDSISRITSGGGNVVVTGTGGLSSNNSRGVFVTFDAQITAVAQGSVTVEGTGGNGGLGNHGIHLVNGSGTTATITSAGGTVLVKGHGRGSGSGIGVFVSDGGQISSGGSATVTVDGTGGSGTGTSNYGVDVVLTGTITSGGGTVHVTGRGGGSGSSSSNVGVVVTGGGRITSGGGSGVTVEGTGGTGAGNDGVSVGATSSTISSGGGPVQVTGTSSAGRAIAVAVAGTISTDIYGGSITLIADSMSILGVISAGTNAVTLQPKTSTAIALGAADSAGTLGLTDSELDQVTAGTLSIGHGVSGDVTVFSTVSRTSSTNLQLISGASIFFNGGSLNTAGGSLILSPGNAASVEPITSGLDIDISNATLGFTPGSHLAIAINGTTADTQYRQLNVVGVVNLNGVDLVLSGTLSPTVGQTFTIVSNDGVDSIIGTFNGLAEGGRIANFLGSGLDANISYLSGTNNNDVVLTVVPPENDGVPDEIENGAPNGGDGNGDGIADSQQPNVTSLPNSANGSYVTLATPAGTGLAQVSAIGSPSPGNAPVGIDFPVGFFQFSIGGISSGSATSATMYFSPKETVNSYYKYGPTSDNSVPHWYEFLFDGTTGAEIDNRLHRIVLHFVDGQRGDNDLTANGVIVDPGSPAFNANEPPVVATNPLNTTAVAGTTATFTAAASGSPTPTLHWQMSTDNGVTFSNIVGATATTYSLTVSVADNGKQYRAVFTNSVSAATTTNAALTVSPASILSAGVAWGTSGNSALVTQADGLRLLPTGRNRDISWLGISSLTITFNGAVPLAASDVIVRGIAIANYGPVTISGDGTTYTIRLAQPINAADRVTVTIANASIAAYTRRLDVLPGDVNDDGYVNSTDAALTRAKALGQTVSIPFIFLDVNGDGVVDMSDFNLVRARSGQRLP